MTSVKARCVFCKKVREIKAGEVKPGDHPMCECGGPLVAEQATVVRDRPIAPRKKNRATR